MLPEDDRLWLLCVLVMFPLVCRIILGYFTCDYSYVVSLRRYVSFVDLVDTLFTFIGYVIADFALLIIVCLLDEV